MGNISPKSESDDLPLDITSKGASEALKFKLRIHIPNYETGIDTDFAKIQILEISHAKLLKFDTKEQGSILENLRLLAAKIPNLHTFIVNNIDLTSELLQCFEEFKLNAIRLKNCDFCCIDSLARLSCLEFIYQPVYFIKRLPYPQILKN